MKLKSTPLYALLLPLLTLAFAGACSHKSDGREKDSGNADWDSAVPAPVRQVATAIAEGDSDRFASMVSYPLARPYPLHDIQNADEMRHYFRQMVDDSLRAVARRAIPSGWHEYGWRGFALEDGQYVWMDDSVYDVPYVSRAERAEMRRLIREDSLSLRPQESRGWRPVACLASQHTGVVYRIDSAVRGRRGEAFRLAVWECGDSLGARPTAVFRGRRQVEGSAGTVTYFFSSPSGATAVYSPDNASSYDAPRILFTDLDGRNTADTVISVHWLDLLHANRRAQRAPGTLPTVNAAH